MYSSVVEVPGPCQMTCRASPADRGFGGIFLPPHDNREAQLDCQIFCFSQDAYIRFAVI